MKFYLTFFLICCFGLTYAQDESATFYNAEAGVYNVDKNNVAVSGYDLVEYHQSHTAIRGSEEFELIHDGVKYHFMDEQNLTTFEANPDEYLPEFGGYCAYGLGMKEDSDGNKPGKYPVDPKSFKIVNGKLYLFYDGPTFDALEYWNKNEQELLEVANKNWGLIHKRSN